MQVCLAILRTTTLVAFLLAVTPLPARSAPPTITPIPDQTVLEDWSIDYQVQASDPDGDLLAFDVSGPAWIAIGTTTGLLTIAPPGGTASPGGLITTATVTVTDGFGTAADGFETTVLDARADQAEHGGGRYRLGEFAVEMGGGDLKVLFHGDADGPLPAEPPPDDGLPPPDDSGPPPDDGLPPPDDGSPPLDDSFPPPDDGLPPLRYTLGDTPVHSYQLQGFQIQGLELQGVSIQSDQPHWVRGQRFRPGKTAGEDLAFRVPWGPSFSRVYNSLLERDQIQHGHLGRNWLGTYDWRLEVNGPIADVTTNRGGKIRFQSPGPAAWTLAAPTDRPHRLTQNGSGFLFFDAVTGWVQRFDASTGRLLSSEDTHGVVLTMGYAGALLTSVSDGLGRTLTFSYDRIGRLIQVSDGTRSVSYTYDAAGNLASFTDAAGGVTQYLYAGGSIPGLLTQIAKPAVTSPYHAVYGPDGEVTSVTDAAGNAFTFTYTRNPSGRITEVQVARPVPGGFTFRSHLDGRCFEVTDPAGGTTSRTFDALGRVATLTRPAGDITSFTYDAVSGWLASVGHPDATSTGFTYASRTYGGLTLFQPSSVSRRDGTSLSYTYDASGNRTSIVEPGSITWSWTYNALGWPLTFTNPSTGVTSYVYDGMGRLIQRTDPIENPTNYTYDALDRLILVTEPGAPGRGYAYDALDRLTAATNELAKTWRYEYDANSRLIRITDPLTLSTEFTWNAMDRLIQSETPLGAQTSYTYDAVGRLTAVADPTSRTTEYEYDDPGRIHRIRDPGGNTTTYTYDANGRVIRRSDPLSNTTQYSYDSVDRLISSLDPVSTTFTFTHDDLDRIRTIAGPLGFLVEYQYNARGHLIRVARGSVAEQYTRNALGLVTAVRDPNGNTWSYGYDAAGRLMSSVDPLTRTTQYSYDARNRLNQVTMPVGSLSLGYDAASRLTQRSYSDGTVIPYAYDDAGRLLSTQGAAFTYDADSRVTGSTGGIGYTYDAAGRLQGMTYAPGKAVSYTYDARGNLNQLEDWVGGATRFTYDPAGRRTGLSRPDGSVTSYVYDAADRLIRLTDVRNDSTAAMSIVYDALGRTQSVTRRQPLSATFKNETASHAYDAAGQIAGYTYDGLGRLLSDGTRSYAWDVASRLTSASDSSGAVRFEYDGFGRATGRTLGSEVEALVFAQTTPLDSRGKTSWVRHKPHVAPGLSRPIRVSSPLTNYVVTPEGELLHSVDDASGARRFYHFDERGNALFLSDDHGSAVTAYGYTVSGSFVDEIGLGSAHLARFTMGAAHGTQQEGKGPLYRAAEGRLFDGSTARWLDPVKTVLGGAYAKKILPELYLVPLDVPPSGGFMNGGDIPEAPPNSPTYLDPIPLRPTKGYGSSAHVAAPVAPSISKPRAGHPLRASHYFTWSWPCPFCPKE